MPIQKDHYTDSDLVYVDPDLKAVVGLVEWSRNGNPKPMAVQAEPVSDEAAVKGKKPERRRSFRKYYPWGTYKSMKKVYSLEGKQRKTQPDKTLDQVIEKALKEPYWD